MDTPVIVYQDNDLFILNKPSGWVVNEASTTKDVPVVQRWLQSLSFPLAHNEQYRSGIVHRLDKETSGLLIVAKTMESFEKLQAAFKSREVEKKYLALVHGKLKTPEGIIEAPVGRLPWNRKRFGILPGGRSSRTSYKVVKEYPKEKEIYTLVSFFPKTGRTHQIRIHAKYIGNPLVGDSFYAGRKTSRKDRKWCPRLFLHAASISFKHPLTGKEIKVDSNLTEDLREVLHNLEINVKTA